MKKKWLLLFIPILGLSAFLVYQNRPSKRFASHIMKARLYANENNLTAAQLEYETAYDIIGKFSPHVSLEVMRLMNRKAAEEKNLGEALSNTRSFVQEHPDNKEGRLILARLAFQTGDLETAFQAVDTLLRLDSTFFAGRMLLAEVRTRQGRFDLAEEQLRGLYRHYPDSLQSLLPLADNLLRQGKTQESRRFLLEALHDHPDNASARLLLVDGYLAERKLDSARAVLGDWQKTASTEVARSVAVRRAQLEALAERFAAAESLLAPYREPKEENGPAISELAQLKAAQGQYDSSLHLYAALGSEVPKTRASCERMEVLLNLKTQNPARALEQAKALQLGNKNAELLPITLAAYQSLGQDNKMQEFLGKQPDSVKAALLKLIGEWAPEKEYIGQWALIEYFRVNNQRFWMLSATQELYKKWPRNAMAVNLFASQLAALGQPAAAAKLLEEQKNPAPGQRAFLLSLYARTGQKDKTAALAEKLVSETPRQAGLNLILAEHALSQGNRAKAVAYYERELENDPHSLAALNNLAWEYGIVQGDLSKAGPYLDKLRAMKIRDARILDTMGWILAKNGKLQEGENLIRQSLELSPDFPGYLFHMGWIRSQMGNKEDARRYIGAALQSKLPFAERKEAESFLAQNG